MSEFVLDGIPNRTNQIMHFRKAYRTLTMYSLFAYLTACMHRQQLFQRHENMNAIMACSLY